MMCCSGSWTSRTNESHLGSLSSSSIKLKVLAGACIVDLSSSLGGVAASLGGSSEVDLTNDGDSCVPWFREGATGEVLLGATQLEGKGKLETSLLMIL